MARQSIPFLAFNRGLVSPKALARVDLDRTRLSAEVFNNYLIKTQGAMRLRPGTKYFGSSLNDTAADWIEFVSATDDVALCEITGGTMRIWLGEDAHNLSLLERPAVDTTLNLSDTGWDNTSTGGASGAGSAFFDVLPQMTANTTSGVTITASSQNITNLIDGTSNGNAWRAADNNLDRSWIDTGVDHSSLPSWWNADFGSGNSEAITGYSVRSSSNATGAAKAPSAWRLIASDHDTGTFANDTGKWTLQDERSAETGWAVSEKRTFSTPEGDTGTVTPRRHWRFHITNRGGSTNLEVAEFELFTATTTGAAGQVEDIGGAKVLNALSKGALARTTRRVVVDTGDVNVEHSLDIHIGRGPVALRVGSSDDADNYISQASLGTGHHNLSFVPEGDFYITFQSAADVDRIVQSAAIGDSGTVEITAPWTASDLDNIRYDQSADVVYLDCLGVKPHKIERRGTGRSWSIVEYEPDDGPFFGFNTSSAKMSISHFYGNTTMATDIPFFKPGHVGALIRGFHTGQSGEWALGALEAVTDPVKVVGINDTGVKSAENERRIVFTVAGAWSGELTIERSFDGPDFGFKKASSGSGGFVSGNITDTGTFTTTIDDPDDNIQVWYRAKMTDYTSGAAVIRITHNTGGVTGVARITDYNSNTNVDVEILSRFSDTGSTDNWQEGYWSGVNGYPTSVALHGGRLAKANGANIFLSVSDDYESFDQNVIGDAGPIIRTLGSGPVDNIFYLVSLLRLIVGTAGAEIAMRSSSLDEPLTPDNSSARAFSTQGSANLRAVKMDTQAVMVQRSRQRVFVVGFGLKNASSIGDYENFELTLLVPDLLVAGIVSVAIQRQPDTRIHCVLTDGTVAVLTYEPQEEVVCWTKWETDGFVEKAMVLPGVSEDAVYYHIRRTINGVTRRFLEKWALEAESEGDTGLSWLADCAVSFSDTGRANIFADVAPHLAGESVIAWGDLDTGSTPYVDLSPDVSGVQLTHTVDTGGDLDLSALGLTEGVTQGVVGLPYSAKWRSTKLAYAAQMGTALTMYKRIDKIGLILYRAHPNGLFYGSDSGHLDPLPRMVDGAIVDNDVLFETIDAFPTPFNGTWSPDSRFELHAKAPRPVTVLACVPVIETNEKV